MSAAFALTPTGPRVNCDFRGCVLEAWHDGNHEFALKEIKWSYDRHCSVCGVPFTVLGADKEMIFDTCGSEACLLHYARRSSGVEAPLLCPCPQREYPHELTIHAGLKQEAYNSKLRYHWPWSLMQSLREEPSTERRTS